MLDLTEFLKTRYARLEDKTPSILLFNLFVDLIDWADANRVDLDAELEEAREHYRGLQKEKR